MVPGVVSEGCCRSACDQHLGLCYPVPDVRVRLTHAMRMLMLLKTTLPQMGRHRQMRERAAEM